MRTVVRDNARMDIAAGRFPLAQKQLDRVLAITPKDPVHAPVLRRPLPAPGPAGQVDRSTRRSWPTRRWRAIGARSIWTRRRPSPTVSSGLLYYQQRLPDRAREAFHQYLALKPDAPDAKRIKEYMVELDR